MALRVARGLFRLWFVLSILWIGAVAVMSWSALPVAPPERDVATPREDESIYVVVGPDGKEYRIAAPKDATNDLIETIAQIKLGPKIRCNAAVWDIIESALKLAFIPPIVVLAIGSVFAWAFRGFRDKDRAGRPEPSLTGGPVWQAREEVNPATKPVQGAPSNLHPWRRFFARMIDLYFFVLLVFLFFFFLEIMWPELFAVEQSRTDARGKDFLYGLAVIAAYSIFEAFCLNVFGGTFGKSLYGIRVAPKAGDRIIFSVALQRSLAVWIRGLGLGIPIVAVVTLLVAYRTLMKNGQTSWDRNFNCVVVHRKLSIARWFVVAIAWLFLLSLYAIGLYFETT